VFSQKILTQRISSPGPDLQKTFIYLFYLFGLMQWAYKQIMAKLTRALTGMQKYKKKNAIYTSQRVMYHTVHCDKQNGNLKK